MRKTGLLVVIFFAFSALSAFSQGESEDCIRVDFNDGKVREANNKITISAPGTNMVEDRFHNRASAIQIQGVKSSYLNLGTSALLKTRQISISLWVKVSANNYFGKGYESNPIIVVRNSEQEDFNLAYALFYAYPLQKFSGGGSRDSLNVVNALGKEEMSLRKWYHLVLTMDDNFACFYINGELQSKLKKGFQSRYNMLDSVLVGHSGSSKNQRYLSACVDDIKIYNWVVDEEKVMELYLEENPNTFKNILYFILKLAGIAAVIGAVIFILMYRNRQQLKKQKEHLELENKINELEIKVIKAQMNPHFISNCLSAIQELIYSDQVEKAVQYIAKFSFFLRKVLAYSNVPFLPLRQEMEMLKLYVELEGLRFNDNFKVSYLIEDEAILNEVSVPALITQPFIENAIWHGLLPLDDLRDPYLEIRISEESQSVIIEITDNGVGRSKSKTENPLKNKGIKMILDRIDGLNKLNDYKKYELTLIDLLDERKVPVGTKVRIVVNSEKRDGYG